jgi:hypothetical protein
MLVYPGRNLSKVDAVAKEMMDAACRLVPLENLKLSQRMGIVLSILILLR